MGQQIKSAVKTCRYYPAEWEKQRTVWLSWPHNEKEWGKERLPKIRRFYEELILKILDFQNVNLIFPDVETLHATSLQSHTRSLLKKIILPNNDIWIRDYGPFFMETINGGKKKLLLIDFEFNAWGEKYPPWDLDNHLPKSMSLYLGQEIESYPIILEGGALEFSGDGLILTTEECLLNKNRNLNLTKEQIELVLKAAFNIEEIIWLKHGLEGDHTDGHIDNVARFINKNKVLINEPENKRLKEIKNQLKDRFELIEIPFPGIDRKEMPAATYINFIFVNGGIIAPTFNCEADKVALEIFKKVFPDRKIIGIDCSLLVQEGGGLHCMTKQEAFFSS